MNLMFNVKNQTITRTDTNNAIQLSKNYLKAKFEFETADWDGLAKTAVFVSGERTWNVLLVNDECLVPYEATKGTGNLYVSVFAGDLITANVAQVYVGTSGYSEGGAPQPPTPDIYNQLTTHLGTIDTAIDAFQNQFIEVEAKEQEQDTAISLANTSIQAINEKLLPNIDSSSEDGVYILKATVSAGEITYEWVLEEP